MKNWLASLDQIAAFLESLEESIIFKILDRSQFARNGLAYAAGQSGFSAFPKHSLFEIRLRFQEEMDARFGRFGVPEERPFTTDLPPSDRQATVENRFPITSFETVSQVVTLRNQYFAFLDVVCAAGDDGHYGSSVEHDVAALQAIARRVHFGAIYVAESKFLADPKGMGRLILAGDTAGLMTLLTRPEVEAKIMLRVRAKLDSIQELVNESVRRKIDPDWIMQFYRDTIIPATKAGEVAYLLARRLES